MPDICNRSAFGIAEYRVRFDSERTMNGKRFREERVARRRFLHVGKWPEWRYAMSRFPEFLEDRRNELWSEVKSAFR